MDEELSAQWLADAGLEASVYLPLFSQGDGVRLAALIELWRENCLDEALQALGVTALGARRCLTLAVERSAQQYTSGGLATSLRPETVISRTLEERAVTSKPVAGSIDISEKQVAKALSARPKPRQLDNQKNADTVGHSLTNDPVRGSALLETGSHAMERLSRTSAAAPAPEQRTERVPRQAKPSVGQKRKNSSAGNVRHEASSARQQTLFEWGIQRRVAEPVARTLVSRRMVASTVVPISDTSGETGGRPLESLALRLADGSHADEAHLESGKTLRRSVNIETGSGKTPDPRQLSNMHGTRSRHHPSKHVAGLPGCVVDSFRVPIRANDGYYHFFLTHYHADHYGGLRRTHFRPGCDRRLYASPITVSILQVEYQFDDAVLVRLPVGDPDGITIVDRPGSPGAKPVARVLACDANHCPGAVILIFQVFETGQTIIHCGDMRYNPICMNRDPVLRRFAATEGDHVQRVAYLHIDTTYSDPRYDFPPQEAVLRALVETAQRDAARAPSLFLCGTYFIGKERVWASLAKALGTNVYIDPSWKRKRRVLLDCVRSLPTDSWRFSDVLTERVEASCVHLVRMADVQPMRLLRFMRRAQSLGFRQVIGVMATGWCQASRPPRGCQRLDGSPADKCSLLERLVLPSNHSCILYKLPYSEHSSYSELRAFIDWIQPEQIVPTVATTAAHLQRLWPRRPASSR
ncbi:similar to DNA cross-link repair protein SNM1 [Cyanidioschyzon merolae strain 10D]|uniref:Similar to DNA cross-link repair protein SNM1 n=1 Tax=Cyanidioschyzon merolae (strain NIES-3377 / 10D) TaxID=280699 RepID=M1UXY6_CYAM1|nr:similar to DNA cross-link repair protein SNM1 [Cyanidioschyzon merolae strain 10D]BAM83416.1 similar to DNA cross-link repair protein SNM1 [Cyanidioschyzon merolae strain 10D]|eukprot:XP_005539452.1 similar to DNA cross-link repair protein SNM1 [Cyanidioschyzon merolae strain 10D]